MKCPSCGSIKQVIPESRRSPTSVWRRRICKNCHVSWITEEQITQQPSLPKEVHQFLDNHMRHTPRIKEKKAPAKKATFDTTPLKDFRW